jgi:polyisoprenyl-phosphate glycosyltransferase
MKLIILSCIFNDWDSAQELLVLLNSELSGAGITAEVLLVDDGSTHPRPEHLDTRGLTSFRSVQVLPLRNNMGHQRAIAIGLSYIYEKYSCDAVVVMDSDGEDEPADVVRLFHALTAQPGQIIFAERSNRSEGVIFTSFYHIYRWFFSRMTGQNIRFGNFSILSYSILEKCVVDMNIWNHYAAAIASSKIKYKTIPSKRGKRLCGKSKLNFTALVIHGLSAMSCYNEIIAARLLFATLAAIALIFSSIVLIILIRLFTHLAIAGWATYTIGILTIIFLQVLLLSTTFMFTLLGNRKNQPFIPLRDYAQFIAPMKDSYVRE